MNTTIPFEGAYVAWKGQVRFVNQLNTVNVKNNNNVILLRSFSHELYSQEEIKISLTIMNVFF